MESGIGYVKDLKGSVVFEFCRVCCEPGRGRGHGWLGPRGAEPSKRLARLLVAGCWLLLPLTLARAKAGRGEGGGFSVFGKVQ